MSRTIYLNDTEVNLILEGLDILEMDLAERFDEDEGKVVDRLRSKLWKVGENE